MIKLAALIIFGLLGLLLIEAIKAGAKGEAAQKRAMDNHASNSDGTTQHNA